MGLENSDDTTAKPTRIPFTPEYASKPNRSKAISGTIIEDIHKPAAKRITATQDNRGSLLYPKSA